MRDSDWSRQNVLRSDWLPTSLTPITTPVGDVKLVCLAFWRKREYLTVISIRFVAFSNQHFADYRS